MPKKISKVAKDLNVGVNTARNFLRKHNISVEEGPNARIDEAAEALLYREFSTDKTPKAPTAPKAPAAAPASNDRKPEVPTNVPSAPGVRVVGMLDEKGASLQIPLKVSVTSGCLESLSERFCAFDKVWL